MKATNRSLLHWCKRLLKTSVLGTLLITLSLGLSGAGWNLNNPLIAVGLPQGNAITDPVTILRKALPIDNDVVRQLEESIEDIPEGLRLKRWSTVNKDVKAASRIVNSNRTSQLLAGVPADRQEEADAILEQMKEDIVTLKEIVKTEDRELMEAGYSDFLKLITQLENLMIPDFPFEVPAEFANLPQLKGRATVEMETSKGILTIVVDGYSAPVNGGNFVDLVNRGFYDGLPFIGGEDFVVQVGDPPGPTAGFIDPDTGEYRAIPLEVLIQGDSEPVYQFTLESIGIYLEPLALPFSAYGTVALGHPPSAPNKGSSQIFFFLFDSELTPPGFNLLDGRYSVFGYIVSGAEILADLDTTDTVISAKVTQGLENFLEPTL